MYSPDSLKRLNDKAVEEYREKLANELEQIVLGDLDPEEVAECDFCCEPAIQIIEVFNPADEVRDPPVEGAYTIYPICEECYDSGCHMNGLFFCPGCGKLFITHHSWDFLAVDIDGEYFCQKCALEEIEPMSLEKVMEDLRAGEMRDWRRVNNVHDREEIWSGEYSDSPDFPGYTDLGTVANAIRTAAMAKGLALKDEVIPLVTHGYQFSVVLGVYH